MLFMHKHGALQSALYGRGAESPRFWKTGYTLRSGIGSGSAWYVDNFPLEENGRGPGVYTNTLIVWQLSDLQEQHQCQLSQKPATASDK